MYYILYRTDNLLNNKFYIGIHKTEKLNDGYLGSGTNIRRAINKYGIENFRRIILESFWTEEEMKQREKEIVNIEFVNRKDTYNIALGGGCGWYHVNVNEQIRNDRKNKVLVKDKNNNYFQVNINDPKYLSGELIHATKNKVIVKNNNGENLCIDINDPKYLSGEFVGITKGKFCAIDKKGNKFFINKNDPRYLSGELYGISKNKIIVNNNNERQYIDKNDPRYLSGEFSHFLKGTKLSEIHLKNISGKNNHGYNKIWIKNINLQKIMRIKKEDLQNWIDNGWIKGKKL